eukprot:TRINITY_DN95817_c0_g1_i1.p1 TRINITY_DN95817_c0_g1~~TRINITY_DN95817_c0_g1_i1.p1  ORF type:complete len:286 (+),score=31.03 TRINITY_DN95817_c0_g1_i1:51-908(+)
MANRRAAKKPAGNCKCQAPCKPVKRPAAAPRPKRGKSQRDSIVTGEHAQAKGMGRVATVDGISTSRMEMETCPADLTADVRVSHSSSRKLNVLCLHGFSMNGERMHEKCQIWERHCSDLATFHYPTAPVVADAQDILVAEALGLPMHSDMRRWASTWQQSKEFIQDYVSEKIGSTVDVVLGFSQGAAIAMKILRETWLSPLLQNIMAAIFVASPKLRTEAFTKDLPTLHIIASADNIVDVHEALEIAAHFTEPTILEHPGGHMDFPQLALKPIRNLLDGIASKIT